MKTRLHVGDYVTQHVRVAPFLHDDILRVLSIVVRRGSTNRVEVIRQSDKTIGWIDEDNLISLADGGN